MTKVLLAIDQLFDILIGREIMEIAMKHGKNLALNFKKFFCVSLILMMLILIVKVVFFEKFPYESKNHWTEVYRSQHGERFYLDMNTLKQSFMSEVYSVEVLQDYSEGDGFAGRKVLSEKSRAEIDCENHLWRGIGYTQFEGPMGTGGVLVSNLSFDAGWVRFGNPDSVGQGVIQTVCGKNRNNPSMVNLYKSKWIPLLRSGDHFLYIDTNTMFARGATRRAWILFDAINGRGEQTSKIFVEFDCQLKKWRNHDMMVKKSDGWTTVRLHDSLEWMSLASGSAGYTALNAACKTEA